MEDKYKVFSVDHNKMLDLMEMVDEQLASRYKKIIDSIPLKILEKLDTGKDFKCEGIDFCVDMMSYTNMLEFQITKYRKYFNASMNIYPFYEDELLEEDDEEIEEIYVDPEFEDEQEDNRLFIFSLTLTNTEDEAKIKINYEEKDGKYKYINSVINGVEIDYEVFVEKNEDEFYLTSKKTFNGIEIYKKVKPIDYSDLINYAAEEIYEDDNENCFDFENDFDGEYGQDLPFDKDSSEKYNDDEDEFDEELEC